MNTSVGTYLITQSDRSGGRPAPDVVRVAVDGGIDVMQLREKHASTRDHYEVDHELHAMATDAGVPLVVSDRIDIAAAVDADGVHLSDDGVPISVMRGQLGEGAIVDRSILTIAGAKAAEEAGADYLGVGAVFTTDMKETNPEQSKIGTEHVSAIAEVVSIPFVGIGGVMPGNTADVTTAGVDGIAVVSTVTAVDDLADVTRHLADSVAAGRSRR